MADYVAALNKGFDAARKADLARKEINAVFKKFKDDIFRASGGGLIIERKLFDEPVSPLQRMSIFEPSKKYWAIAAHNPTVKQPTWKELARWQQSPDGYPCSIILERGELQFQDREALEKGLERFLRDPRVGEKLYLLSKQK
jgi:hypothetical protein